MNKMFFCIDCGFDTFQNEYYVVKDEIWPIKQNGGMLCIGCLEKRIGRSLTKDDFTDCLVNTDLRPRSKRLQDRLKMQKYIWWKEIILGPLSDSQLDNLNWQNIEYLIDDILENDRFPKTPALNQDMAENPNVPHILMENE